MDIYPNINGRINDWDIIVIGHLRVNTYFGESYDNPPRGYPSTCTSVMIRGIDGSGEPYVLIVDPTTRLTAEDYDFDVNRRTGLRLGDVTHCFFTHHHADHYEALDYFPFAQYFAPPDVARLISGQIAESLRNKGKGAVSDDCGVPEIIGVTGEFLPGVCSVPLPGHTAELCGVAFSHNDRKIIVAGDSVMTKYHFAAGTTDFQKEPALVRAAAQSIQNMKESYDIVVPGHDNMILI